MDLLWPSRTPRVGVKSYLCLQWGGEPGRQQAAMPDSIPQIKAPGEEPPSPTQAAQQPHCRPVLPAPAIRAPAHPCTCLLGHDLSRSPKPCHFRDWNRQVPVVTSLHRFGVTSKPKAASREAQAPAKVGSMKVTGQGRWRSPGHPCARGKDTIP